MSYTGEYADESDEIRDLIFRKAEHLFDERDVRVSRTEGHRSLPGGDRRKNKSIGPPLESVKRKSFSLSVDQLVKFTWQVREENNQTNETNKTVMGDVAK